MEQLTPQHFHLPQSYGRYVICNLLGEGAMGRVYLAEDPVLDRKVAIKVIAINNYTEQRTREEYLSRFSIEARASARLNHPSIVTIFDAGEEHGIPWIAFEYVDGDQLEKMLHQEQPLAIDLAVAITLDITAALHHAHECGIIHRDIKPANILIDKRTRIAKLADFGVVKAPWVALTQDGSTVGSPGYMAPEQLEGSGADARSDLFSLGIVLYQMLTNKHPFLRNSIPATIFATLHGNFTPVPDLRPDTPPYLAECVAILLASDPTVRFQTAAMLLHELRCGSRPQLAGSIDKNAYVGNTTRLHRISHLLQNTSRRIFRPSAAKTTPRTFSLTPAITALRTFFSSAIARLDALPIATVKKLFGGTLITTVVFALLFFAYSRSGNDRTIAEKLKTSGYGNSFPAIVDSCEYLIGNGKSASAAFPIEHLVQTSRYRTEGLLLQCRAALAESDDEKLVPICSALTKNKNWQHLRKASLPALVKDCEQRLEKKRADTLLIRALATTLLFDQKRQITGWIKQEQYWLRWNSVKIAGVLSMQVDSVALYILDLEHGGSISTRSHAATRLGELGDKRAIDPLKKAADVGLRDPIVSYTADLVLKNYFNKNKPSP